MSEYGEEISKSCSDSPNVELMISIEEWCKKLTELEKRMRTKTNADKSNTLCLFIGLEITSVEMSRLVKKDNRAKRQTSIGGVNFSDFLEGDDMNVYLEQDDELGTGMNNGDSDDESEEFDAMPIIRELFSLGTRTGIRCVVEATGYRLFKKDIGVGDMCRHRIAFDMTSEDCTFYLGTSSFQSRIGQFAVYGNGGKEVMKLLPFCLNKE